MDASTRPDVTALLQSWSHGDKEAHDKLWPIVFAELSRLAHRALKHEPPDHTLQSGDLVSEAYTRLVDWKTARWRNRAHFFGMCARIMRQILVDHARARACQKRGGGRNALTLEESAVVSPTRSEQLLALDEALTRLATISKRKSDVVELRFFAGLEVEETAAVLGVSRLTVIRDWNFARAWLLKELGGNNPFHHT